MKKFGLSIILLCSCIVSPAQVEIGLKGGPSAITTLYHSEPTPYKLGFDAGFFCDIPMGKHFFFSPQFLYSSKGYQTTSSAYTTLSYLSMPLLIGYYISSHFQFLLGPEAGLLLHAFYEYPPTNFSENLISQYRTIDIGLNGTIIYRINRYVGLNFTYSRSLRGIQTPTQIFSYAVVSPGNIVYATYSLSEKDNLRNEVFQFGIYYFMLH